MKFNLLFYHNFMPYIPCIKSEFFVNHVKGDFHNFFVNHVKGDFHNFFVIHVKGGFHKFFLKNILKKN
jgi:hypothetical protein